MLPFIISKVGISILQMLFTIGMREITAPLPPDVVVTPAAVESAEEVAVTITLSRGEAGQLRIATEDVANMTTEELAALLEQLKQENGVPRVTLRIEAQLPWMHAKEVIDTCVEAGINNLSILKYNEEETESPEAPDTNP